MKKKYILLLSSIMLAAGITACNQSPTVESSEAQSDAVDTATNESLTGLSDDAQLKERNERKARSMAIVAERDIYVMAQLPLIEAESEAAFQTTEEIARRGVALMVLALYSESMLNPEVGYTVEEAKVYINQIIKQYGIEDDFSPAEKAYLENSNPTEMEMINYSWQYENLGVMLWALGLMDELPFPDTIVDVGLAVQRVNQFETIDEMVAGTTPKTPAEILDAADLIYRLDWACVEARINGKEAPGNLDSGVVMERHKSLNWLIRRGEDWDEIDIST